jgi:hypothetical protein
MGSLYRNCQELVFASHDDAVTCSIVISDGASYQVSHTVVKRRISRITRAETAGTLPPIT